MPDDCVQEAASTDPTNVVDQEGSRRSSGVLTPHLFNKTASHHIIQQVYLLVAKWLWRGHYAAAITYRTDYVPDVAGGECTNHRCEAAWVNDVVIVEIQYEFSGGVLQRIIPLVVSHDREPVGMKASHTGISKLSHQRRYPVITAVRDNDLLPIAAKSDRERTRWPPAGRAVCCTLTSRKTDLT